MTLSIPLVTDDAVGVVYKFMTEEPLHSLEVTVVNPSVGEIGFYTSADLPDEASFRKICSGMILSAVAAFDSDDTSRVNLSVGADMAVLSVYDEKDEASRDELCRKIL